MLVQCMPWSDISENKPIHHMYGSNDSGRELDWNDIILSMMDRFRTLCALCHHNELTSMVQGRNTPGRHQSFTYLFIIHLQFMDSPHREEASAARSIFPPGRSDNRRTYVKFQPKQPLLWICVFTWYVCALSQSKYARSYTLSEEMGSIQRKCLLLLKICKMCKLQIPNTSTPTSTDGHVWHHWPRFSTFEE